MGDTGQRPREVFISYSHKDDGLCQEFVTHLSQLQRDGLIQGWHDRRISGGSEWAGQIDEHLNSADIIVLLVSPDFLASNYCYDIEVKRALERHDAREARVTPVILRPADWHTSPFAKLNALPKDGKPVVDWPSHDHGFLNVVEGLRRVAAELRQPAPRSEPPSTRLPVVPRTPRKIRWWPAAAAIAFIALAIAGWFWWAKQRQYVAQGDASLNIGRYEGAREPYQQALRLNPANRGAAFGLKIVDLAKLKPDPVNFEQRLKQLLQEVPHDPHLKVLEGDYLVGLSRPDDALSRYQEAAKLAPNLAEAYFRMGVLYDLRDNIAQAQAMYQRAVDLAPSSPQYACNLADQYFKHGEYKDAIRVYDGIRQFPYAPIESAKIYRLLGDLKAAADLEHTAIEWMGDPAVTKSPEYRLPWWVGEPPLSLSSQKEKFCYAHLEYAATLYVDGDGVKSKEQIDRAMNDCGALAAKVESVIASELKRLAEEQSELSSRIAGFRKFLLQ